MAYSNIHPIQSFTAGADNLAYGTAVKLDTGATSEATVIQATNSDSEDIVGFVFNPVYHTGLAVGVIGQEGNKVEVLSGESGALAIGDKVKIGAGGKVVKTTSGKYVGVVMTPTSAQDQYLTIMIERGTIAGA